MMKTMPTRYTSRRTYGRIQGNALQRIRRQVFKDNPLCVHCYANDRITLAKQVDHIVPLEHGGKEERTNRQGLCIRCHEIKTAKDRGLRLTRKIGVDGYPVDDDVSTNKASTNEAPPQQAALR